MAIDTDTLRARFVDIELDLASGELTRNERIVRLPAQPLLVLRILLDRAGEVVTREELQRQLWSDVAFGDFDHGLNKAVGKLRDAIQILEGGSDLIQTIPRRGYRMNAKVDWIGPPIGSPNVPNASPAERPFTPAHHDKFGFWLGIGLALALLLGAGIASSHLSSGVDRPRPTPTIRSLAVLPLTNLSSNSDEDYLAAGITEELSTDLSHAKSLRVISRASTSRFQGSRLSIPQIAEQLHVDAVIEGTVLRSNNTIRVTIRLLTSHPERETWASSYERSASDAIALQNQIAADAVYQIRAQLTPEEQDRLKLESRINSEAYDEYLRGRYILHKETTGTTKAIPHLERAIQLDPNFAAAYAALGEAWGMDGVWRPDSNAHEVYAKALEYSQAAVDLDPDSAEANASLGHSLMQNRRWKEAEAALRRAIQLDPHNLEAIEYLTLLLTQKDRLAEALALSREAALSNPVAVDFQHVYAMTLYLARRYEESVAESRSVLELDPNRTAAYGTLAYALVEEGRYNEAEAAFDRSDSMNPGLEAWLYAREGNIQGARRILNDNSDLINIPSAAARYLAGDKERGLAELDYLANKRWATKTYRMRVDPIFDPMRNDPRFYAIVKKTGLYDN